MDDSTKTMMLTLASGVIKKGLMTLGATAATHGIIASNQTETFVAAGMFLVGAGWSFWNDYGKAIVLSKIEVLKAQSLAQAAKLRSAGIAQPTVTEIAAQHPTLTPADVTKAVVVKILIAAFLLSAFLFAPPAMAQSRGPIGQKIHDDLAGKGTDRSAAVLDNIATALAKPFKDIADFIGSDADGAVKLATVIPTLQDGHGQQCWIAMKSFGDIIKAHPVPITFHVLQDYETLRLLGMATNNLCSNTHCTQVFADLTSMAQAASPVQLAIPSLHDLCTKVPQIAAIPAGVVPSPTPAAAAVPAPAVPIPPTFAAPTSTDATTAPK